MSSTHWPVNGQRGPNQRIHMTHVSHFWRLWRCTLANLCTTAGRRSKARRRRSDLSVQVAKDMIRFWPDLSRSDCYQWVSVWAWLMEPQGDDLVYVVSLSTISWLTENSFTTMCTSASACHKFVCCPWRLKTPGLKLCSHFIAVSQLEFG